MQRILIAAPAFGLLGLLLFGNTTQRTTYATTAAAEAPVGTPENATWLARGFVILADESAAPASRTAYECQRCVGESVFIPGSGWYFVHHYEEDDICYMNGASEWYNFCHLDPQNCHSDDHATPEEWCPADACIDPGEDLLAAIAVAARAQSAEALLRAVAQLTRPAELDLGSRSITVRGCGGRVLSTVVIEDSFVDALFRELPAHDFAE